MKHPVTLRIDPTLLQAAKHHAQVENRTLTNFVETVLRRHLATASAGLDATHPPATKGHATEPTAAAITAGRNTKRKTARG